MIRRLLLLALIATTPLTFPPLHAEDAVAVPVPQGTPLVTLRFNQRNLYYEKALYNAVSKARATKPDVVFIVILHPALQGSPDTNASRVMTSIRNMGVPESQVRGGRSESSGRQFDEVLVYVQ